MTPTVNPRVLVALGVVYLVWSSTYLAVRHMVASMPPMLAGGARFVIAGALLFAVQRLRGEAPARGRDWGSAALSGTLLFAVGNGLICVAETRVSSNVAAVACATTPLLAAAMNAAAGERPHARELMSLLFGFVGVLVLGLGADISGAGARGALLLLSPVAWALGTLVARRAQALSAVTYAAQQMVCGGVVMLAAAAAVGERWPATVTPAAWGAWAYLMVVGSVLTFPAYGYLVKNARPAVAMSYAYVNPMLAVLLGAAGGETVSRGTVLALGLVLAALWVLVTARRSPASPSDQGLAGGTSDVAILKRSTVSASD